MGDYRPASVLFTAAETYENTGSINQGKNILSYIETLPNTVACVSLLWKHMFCFKTCLIKQYTQKEHTYGQCVKFTLCLSVYSFPSRTYIHTKHPCLSLITFQHAGWCIITYLLCANLQQCPHVNYEMEEHSTRSDNLYSMLEWILVQHFRHFFVRYMFFCRLYTHCFYPCKQHGFVDGKVDKSDC